MAEGNGGKVLDKSVSVGNLVSVGVTIVSSLLTIGFVAGMLSGKFEAIAQQFKGVEQRIERSEADVQRLNTDNQTIWRYIGNLGREHHP